MRPALPYRMVKKVNSHRVRASLSSRVQGSIPSICLASWNPNGLYMVDKNSREEKKRKLLNLQADVMCVQETHVCENSVIQFSKEFPLHHVYNNLGSSSSGGCAILVRKSWLQSLQGTIVPLSLGDASRHGFSHGISISWGDNRMDVCNIYLHSNDKNIRIKQIKEIGSRLSAANNTVIIGDMNCVDGVGGRIKLGDGFSLGGINREEQSQIMESWGKKGFTECDNPFHTYIDRGGRWASRIDRCFHNFGPTSLKGRRIDFGIPLFKKWKIDHRPITLECAIKKPPTGNPSNFIPRKIAEHPLFEDYVEKIYYDKTDASSLNPWKRLEALIEAFQGAAERIRKTPIHRVPGYP